METEPRTVSWVEGFDNCHDRPARDIGGHGRKNMFPDGLSPSAANGAILNRSQGNDLCKHQKEVPLVRPFTAHLSHSKRNISNGMNLTCRRQQYSGGTVSASQKPRISSARTGNGSKSRLGPETERGPESARTRRTAQQVSKRVALLSATVRPLSAPVPERQKTRKALTRSANSRERSRRAIAIAEDLEMHKLVRKATDAKVFQKDVDQQREEERLLQEEETTSSSATPVFNKRLFISQGTVIITREARRLMYINARDNATGDCERPLSKSECLSLRCVTEGLKLIHKSQDFVQDVLSRVVTFEIHKAFSYVPVQAWEETLSCFYVLNGAVEVTYDMTQRESRNVYQPNIIYSHGSGEYLGLVSPEGVSEDLTPPATIYTKEQTQFIRVDRNRFHKLMQRANFLMDKRKRTYISSHSFLTAVTDEVKEKILPKLTIQEYPANRVLLTQGEMSEYVYIVISGRCQCYREVFIQEAEKEVLFYLEGREPDDFFGEECLLDNAPSYCTIVTATASTFLKLHRSALQIVNRDRLTRFIEQARHEFPSDLDLQDRGYRNSLWSRYKHTQIKGSLAEGGKMKYLRKSHHAAVHMRGPCEEEQYTENMYRFIMKGSNFEPLSARAQSAVVKKHGKARHTKIRPQTAAPRMVPENEKPEDSKTDNKENEETRKSQLMTASKAKAIENTLTQAMESKENMLKLLEENPDLSHQLKQTLGGQESGERENFMKNGVLVTMKTEDIVRKAKALADTYADKWKDNNADTGDEDWHTILHAENKQAKMLISANKIRINDLKRRMTQLQKRREKLGMRRPREEDDITVQEVSSSEAHPGSQQERTGHVMSEVNGEGHEPPTGDQRSFESADTSLNRESGATGQEQSAAHSPSGPQVGDGT